MVDIHHSGVCAAPLGFTFAWVDDYRNATRFMFGLSQFDPAADAPDHGLGARYDGVFKTGPIKIKSTVEVVDWRADELIQFDSIKGFRTYSAWRFSAEDDAHTRVSVDFAYEVPGGLAGRALSKALEPVVAPAIKHSDAQLRSLVEQAWAAQNA